MEYFPIFFYFSYHKQVKYWSLKQDFYVKNKVIEETLTSLVDSDDNKISRKALNYRVPKIKKKKINKKQH